MTTKLTLTIAAAAGLLFLTSCGPKETDKIGDAQMCLDTATAANVGECVEKVSGIESAGAYVIRCSANFIQQGFGDPKTIVDTFNSLTQDPANGTKAFLSTMVFSTTAEADDAYNNCQKTTQKGFATLAMAVKSATYILSLGIGSLPANPSVTDVTNAINAIVSGTNQAQAASTIGNAVVATYQLTCQSGSQTNATLCDQMDQAFATAGTTDPATIGLAILNQWKNH